MECPVVAPPTWPRDDAHRVYSGSGIMS
jgi:hypothetical protein